MLMSRHYVFFVKLKNSLFHTFSPHRQNYVKNPIMYIVVLYSSNYGTNVMQDTIKGLKFSILSIVTVIHPFWSPMSLLLYLL